MTDHVVVEHPAGGWNVRSATEDRKIEHHYRQDAAISAACTKIRETGGGDLSVHDKHGRIWHPPHSRRASSDHLRLDTNAAGPRGNLSDGALLRRIATADVDAFAVFYDRHIASAHALAVHILRGGQPADDVCQDAFLAAWRSATSFDSRLGSGRSWILQITRNRAIDHLRKGQRTIGREIGNDQLFEQHAAPDDEQTESVALRDIAATRTRELLADLSDEQREADRALLLRGLHAPRGRPATRPAPRHHQGPYSSRPGVHAHRAPGRATLGPPRPGRSSDSRARCRTATRHGCRGGAPPGRPSR